MSSGAGLELTAAQKDHLAKYRRVSQSVVGPIRVQTCGKTSEELIIVVNFRETARCHGIDFMKMAQKLLRWLPVGRDYYSINSINESTSQLYIAVHVEDTLGTPQGLVTKLFSGGLVDEQSHKLTPGELKECLTLRKRPEIAQLCRWLLQVYDLPREVCGLIVTQIEHEDIRDYATLISCSLVSSQTMTETWRQIMFNEFDPWECTYFMMSGWHGCGNVWTVRCEDDFFFRGPVWGEYYRLMKGFDLFVDEIQGNDDAARLTYPRYMQRLAERERFGEATV
jgi:hypothetical protein